MIGWRLFIAGVFLTPFALLRPVPEVGVSVADLLLATGGSIVLFNSFTGTERRLAGMRPILFYGVAILLVLSTLVSGLVSLKSPMLDVAALTIQYVLVFVLIPAVLARQPVVTRVNVATAFVHGLAVSIALGLAIIAFLPAVERQLFAHGFMAAVAGDRYGLFTGVGALSKVSAMSIPIIYYLALRGHISSLRAGLLGGACVTAIVVARSGSGFLTAILVIVSIGIIHVLLRGHIHHSSAKVAPGKMLLVLAGGVGVGLFAIARLDAVGGNYGAEFTARVSDPLSSGGIGSVGSAQVRFQLIHEAWSVIGEHPVWGIGPGLYQAQSAYEQGVHVVPLMLWAETGILALAAWHILILGIALVTLRERRQAPIAAVATIAILVGLISTHFTAPYMYGRPLILPALIGFFLLGDRQVSCVKGRIRC